MNRSTSVAAIETRWDLYMNAYAHSLRANVDGRERLSVVHTDYPNPPREARECLVRRFEAAKAKL